jgi:hypothetical protein
MQTYLNTVVSNLAKVLTDEDLANSSWELIDGHFHYCGQPVDFDTHPEQGLLLAKALNPNHETAQLIAAELEVAQLLFVKRRDDEKRAALRSQLTGPGAEVQV